MTCVRCLGLMVEDQFLDLHGAYGEMWTIIRMTRSILVPSPLSDEWPDKATRQQRGMPLAYTRLPGSFERVIPPPKLYGFLVSSAVPLYLKSESGSG